MESQALVGILSAQLRHQQFFASPVQVKPLPADGADVLLGAVGAERHAVQTGDLR